MDKWIPVKEKPAEGPCLACDEFGQLWIPYSILGYHGRCYDGKGFNMRFDNENIMKFLKGEQMVLDGETVYLPPREIIAWMPLPDAYEEV